MQLARAEFVRRKSPAASEANSFRGICKSRVSDAARQTASPVCPRSAVPSLEPARGHHSNQRTAHRVLRRRLHPRPMIPSVVEVRSVDDDVDPQLGQHPSQQRVQLALAEVTAVGRIREIVVVEKLTRLQYPMPDPNALPAHRLVELPVPGSPAVTATALSPHANRAAQRRCCRRRRKTRRRRGHSLEACRADDLAWQQMTCQPSWRILERQLTRSESVMPCLWWLLRLTQQRLLIRFDLASLTNFVTSSRSTIVAFRPQ